MQWVADTIHPRRIHAVIEKQTLRSVMPGVPNQDGFYLYVWENDKGIDDDLQDDLEAAVNVAYERYGIPKDIWRQVE
ncbi:MAG: hypothetical protein WDO70_08725 [Alphaproteobacteria bacterium]